MNYAINLQYFEDLWLFRSPVAFESSLKLIYTVKYHENLTN